MRYALLLLPCLLLTACGHDYTPRDKQVEIDHQTGELILPHPCPDWSKSTVGNYTNSQHSNYGCAVNNNLAVQLADPWDLKEGIGNANADTEASVRTIERYRSGEIPAALTPQQDTGNE